MFNPQIVATTLWYLVRFINMLIVIRIVLQFINMDPSNPIAQFIYGTTEPILAPIRNLIHNVFGYSGFLDFSPLVAMVLVEATYSIIIKIL